MKRLALLPLMIVLAACGSSSSFGIPNSRTVDDCVHGDVEVRVALTGSGAGMERTEDRLTFTVEVANNSRQDIIVKAIRVEPLPNQNAQYQLDNSYRSFTETIPENEEHQFELPVAGRVIRRQQPGQTVGDSSRSLGVAVTVVLEGGDSYRCHFEVPSPVY